MIMSIHCIYNRLPYRGLCCQWLNNFQDIRVSDNENDGNISNHSFSMHVLSRGLTDIVNDWNAREKVDFESDFYLI